MNQLSEYDIRRNKVTTLRNIGINPYSQQRKKSHNISDLHLIKDLRSIDDILISSENNISLAGRIMLKRVSGKLAFWQIQDESGTIQIMFEHQQTKLYNNNPTPSQQEKRQEIMWETTKSFDYRAIDKFLDVGDFIGLHWELFITHKGELTLFVWEYQLLSKAIRPLGDKFHGIGEWQETAYRQRYLDMIFNRDTLERMKLRSQFLQVIRQFYRDQGFIEVETPVLWNSASGAAARPFITHHNDFDTDMYLRISPETSLKKITVGMFEKIFEVAKDFRNEGSDPSHHQEFTMIEHYAAYRNHEDNMAFTESMFDYIFTKLPALKKTISVTDKNGISKEVNFQTPWPRIDYIAQIKKDSGIDVSAYTDGDEEQLRLDIKASWHQWEWLDKQGLTTMIDYLYKKVTRPQIVWPAFIVNYPKLMQPLARVSDENNNIVEQRQLLINWWEVIKAYSELVDPIQQQTNFDAQAGALAAWDEEATSGDPDFVQAMEYGMPPQSGRGMGIDRIFALLTEQENIRDVILFPLMKSENKSDEK
jgi:lysyl-tRNA synthetase, class II